MDPSDFLYYAPPTSVTNPAGLNTTFGGINPLDPAHPAFEFWVICTFAISGQYGFIARQMYYFTLVFSLVVCNRNLPLGHSSNS